MPDLVVIFCEIDDFCKDFIKQRDQEKLENSDTKAKNNLIVKTRNRKFTMTMSEVMTLSIWYHFSGYGTFKDYYTKHVQQHLQNDFPNLVSYNRFIELRKTIIMPLIIYLMTKKLATSTGVSFIDSFKIEACHIKRASSNKVLKGIAKKGKTSVGWFFGIKVHMAINPYGEIIDFCITPGNVADNNQSVLLQMTKKIMGKLFGDRGYIVNPKTFEKLLSNGVRLVTKVRKNMKNKLMDIGDKLLLKKRGIIESTGNILKNRLDMEHTRHRSAWGFFLNIFSSITAYQIREKKPSIAVFSDAMLAAA